MAACNSSNSIGMFLIRHMIMVLLSNLTDSAQNWKLSAFEYLHLQASLGLSPVITLLMGSQCCLDHWNVSQIVINVAVNTGHECRLWEVKKRGGSFKEL